MRVTQVEYSILKNLGNYEHQKVGVTVELEPGESPAEAIKRAKAFCEKVTEPPKDSSQLDYAKRILENSDDYTPKQYRWAEEYLEQNSSEADDLPF